MGGVESEMNEIRQIMQNCFKKDKHNLSCHTRSVLLHGNSGTGKTTIAKYIAFESKVNVVNISVPDLYIKNSNSAEEIIKEKFQQAIDEAPTVIIIDEIDILCPVRSSRLTDTDKRIVSSFLLMFDYLNEKRSSRVFIIATTNKIDNIDPVFRRCGRLDREIEIGTPTPTGRKDIFTKLLNQTSHRLDDNDIKAIAMKTHGFVGADLISLCSRASISASVRSDKCLTFDDFLMSLKKVRPSAMREVQIEVS